MHWPANRSLIGWFIQLSIVLNYLQPLFLATPVALGGLGLDAPAIGLILGSNGIIMGVFQVIFFAPLHRKFGTRTTFIASLATYFVIFLSWPLMSLFAKRAGKLDANVILVLALQQLITAFSGVGFSEYHASIASFHRVSDRVKVILSTSFFLLQVAHTFWSRAPPLRGML